MAQILDTAAIREIEKFVIDRLITVGRVPVLDQIALALHRKPADLSDLPDRCPAYFRLLDLKPKYIAQLAESIRAAPARFSTLEFCADQAEIQSVEDELSQQLKGPNGDGPKVA
jgi:hypothetical protein